MEILREFGVDPMLLLAQIVNFLIIAYLIKRFALKPIMAMLKNREEIISKGLQQAEEAKLLLEQAKEEESRLLKRAQEHIKKMQDDAKTQSREMLRLTEETAKRQQETMLQEAKRQIGYETKEAERRLTAHISELAMMMLERSALELFGPDEQDIVVKNAIKKLKQKRH